MTDRAAELEAALRDRRERDGYVLPDYGGHCFAGVPGAVGDALGVDLGAGLPGSVVADTDTDVSHVVLALVDGFGWDCWRRDRDRHDLLAALADAGTVTPLTSIAPSETAAAITTLHTGRTAAEHGLLGWDQYLPGADALVEPLPFSVKGDAPGSAGDVLDPADLFEGETVAARLADTGAAMHTVQPASNAGSPYSERVAGPAETHPYETVADAALETRRVLAAASDPTYCYTYFPQVDGAAHRAGTGSDRYRAHLGAIAGALGRELAALDPGTAAETLVLLAADHGHVDTEPGEFVDLYGYEAVTDSLARRPNGDPVPPVGGPRMVHLHLRAGAAPRVRDALAADLDAHVVTQAEAFEAGLFGGDPCETARARCGDVVLAHRDRTVWYAGDEAKVAYVGTHGGLHGAEMLVPFAAARADRLQGSLGRHRRT